MDTIDDRLKMITTNVNEIILNKLMKLDYINENVAIGKLQHLKRIIIDDDSPVFDSIALYVCKLNSILIQPQHIKEMNDKQLTQIVLHEYIHAVSANLSNNTVGYDNGKLPITFNEGCTQWLTLKLTNENMNEAIKNNNMYPESVVMVNEMIQKFGEEKVFSHFFDSSVKSMFLELDKNNQDIFFEYIDKFKNLKEEQISKTSLSNLINKINLSQNNNHKNTDREL